MKWMALLAFGGLGLVMLIGGLAWGWQRYSLHRVALHAQGKVVGQYETVSNDTDDRGRSLGTRTTYYYPIVEFGTADGQTQRIRASTGSAVPDYETGATVAVLYDPNNPSNAQLADFSQFWLGPVVVSVAGLMLLLIGAGTYALIAENERSFDAAFQQGLKEWEEKPRRDGSSW